MFQMLCMAHFEPTDMKRGRHEFVESSGDEPVYRGKNPVLSLRLTFDCAQKICRDVQAEVVSV